MAGARFPSKHLNFIWFCFFFFNSKVFPATLPVCSTSPHFPSSFLSVLRLDCHATDSRTWPKSQMSHPTDVLPSLSRSQTQVCLRQTEQRGLWLNSGGGTQLVRGTEKEARKTTSSNKAFNLKSHSKSCTLKDEGAHLVIPRAYAIKREQEVKRDSPFHPCWKSAARHVFLPLLSSVSHTGHWQ